MSTTTTPPSSRAVTGPPIPTLSYGSGGSFTISCSARIAATPRACLDVIVKSSEYPKWNRFCRKCTIDSQPNPQPQQPQQQPQQDEEDNLQLQLGTQFTFDVHLDPSEPDTTKPGQAVALEVSALEPINDEEDPQEPGHRRKGWRIAWRQRPSLMMPAWMLRSERVQEFVEVAVDGGDGDGDGSGTGTETEYRCWETFYGVLAPVVRMAAGKQVERGFDAWLEGLKGLAEGGGQTTAASAAATTAAQG
ncbi:uncharacterized protein B0H64DRAFT_76521 [Chaetomium fimeti]|uniref:Coenzyme Q-binding protein COQ10 START domain-containing protein n=1 Tax=Chaetomium fimeti TaxID=1854472 RepID=A0AAE0HL13_9PEZI|nr:hypothetical protein B0H64DRAFT_76521 [Chaetomium fimeti]